MTSRCRPTVDCCEETVAAETQEETTRVELQGNRMRIFPLRPAKYAMKLLKHQSFGGVKRKKKS